MNTTAVNAEVAARFIERIERMATRKHSRRNDRETNGDLYMGAGWYVAVGERVKDGQMFITTPRRGGERRRYDIKF